MKISYRQLNFINDTIKDMIEYLEDCYNVEFDCTSIYRHGDKGVHGQIPVRGFDISCPDKDFGHLIERRINSKWIYDPSRPDMKCCIYHDVGQGFHIHLQSHPNTILR